MRKSVRLRSAFRTLAVALVTILAVPPCLPATASASDELKIALVAPLSGRWARQGQLKKMGAEMAIEEINGLVPSAHGVLSASRTRPSPVSRRRSWATGGRSR